METSNSPAFPGRGAVAVERALLVSVRFPQDNGYDDVAEFRRLAESAGVRVCGQLCSARRRLDAATLLGRGKVAELRQAVVHDKADVILVDHTLSPAQQRNLEKALECRVLDRSGLILDIFAQRARSHEGKLQVELAQLEHLATRLVRGWTHLERQKGGIGLRGPGETQLETDRRLIRARIKKLQQRLQRVRSQRSSRRRMRHKVPSPTVSLVGYTNTGKSSLFHARTHAEVFAADQLFATLDPTMRRVALPGNVNVILADTVGFIRQLPHDLIEAFKATLEEVVEADLLLHVVDSSGADKREMAERVGEVLHEIGAQAVPQIVVFNKIDLAGRAPRLERDANGNVARVWLSATTGDGIALIREALSEHFRRRRIHRRLRLPPNAGRLRARVHERLHVVGERPNDAGGWEIDVTLEPRDVAWMQKQDGFQSEYWAGADSSILAGTGS
ncbi:MAG: ribosome rescue GTPase HflX [Acidiferrobacterales bacterium]